METKIAEMASSPDIRTPLPGPRAKAIIDRDHSVVSPSYTRSYPLVIARGSGAMVEDVDGNVFLDCSAGIAVTATGHSHPDVVAAISRQAAQFVHMSGTDFYYHHMPDLARKLESFMPDRKSWRCFFGNSGAEAIEAGAGGIVSKRWDVGLLIAGIRRAAAGDRALASAAPPATLKRRGSNGSSGRSSEPAAGPAALTARELEILTALASGLSTVEVARALHISPLTVRSHVKNILFKLGVHSKLEAVTLAIRGGLVRVDRTA